MFKCKKFAFLSEHRIRNPSEFSVVFSRGKSFAEGCFVFHALKTERNIPRLGILINKRYVRLAAKRNNIRRVIRERFRLMQHQFIGFDLVVSLRDPIDKSTTLEQAKWFEKLFLQLARYCDGVF